MIFKYGNAPRMCCNQGSAEKKAWLIVVKFVFPETC